MTHANRAKFDLPRILGLYDKRLDGDDALWQLAALRFRQGGLGAEFYAESPARLQQLLQFKPAPDTPATVHLPRDVDLYIEAGREQVLEFARSCRDQLWALVVHDQRTIAEDFPAYVKILGGLDNRLQRLRGGPCLFVEYAAGLQPELFLRLHQSIRDLERVGACLDVGHLGLRQARAQFRIKHPERDLCSITPDDPELPAVIEDVQEAVQCGLEAVLEMTEELGRLAKPVHLHLHDAHPLATLSPFGISDHLSFLEEIPLPFAYAGRHALHPMFGPGGLARIIQRCLDTLGPQQVSFMLEIHPTAGRLPLRDAALLFRHWTDTGNAERMNYWLSVLLQNRLIIEDVCRRWAEEQEGERRGARG